MSFIKINQQAISNMTEDERRYCELTYLDLAYSYELEWDNRDCGSRRMSSDPQTLLLGYTRAEKKLLSSFQDLFEMSKRIHERAGIFLVNGIVSRNHKTPENALDVWHYIYFAIDKLKKGQAN